MLAGISLTEVITRVDLHELSMYSLPPLLTA